MKIVIDMPEENYQVMLAKIMLNCRGCKITELPKGHGRLIDADDVKENHKRWIGYLDEDMIARLNISIDKYIPTIIEADKEG